MSTPFDLAKVMASKQELRKELAARPIAEKLRLLDELRRRSLKLKSAKPLSPKPDSLTK